MRFPSSLLPGLPCQDHTVQACPVSFTKPWEGHQWGHVGTLSPAPGFLLHPQTYHWKLQDCAWHCQCSTCSLVKKAFAEPSSPSKAVSRHFHHQAVQEQQALAGPSVSEVTALFTQSWSQFVWAGDEERAYTKLQAWTRLFMLNPHSFLTVFHGLLSLVFTPGACQASLAWMQVHCSTEKQVAWIYHAGLPQWSQRTIKSHSSLFHSHEVKACSAFALNMKHGYKFSFQNSPVTGWQSSSVVALHQTWYKQVLNMGVTSTATALCSWVALA